MQNILHHLPNIFTLLAWTALWFIGGVWTAKGAFNLRRNEVTLVGFAIGLVMQTWLVNLLAQVLPFQSAIWLAAVFVLLVGLAFLLPSGWRELYRIPVYPLQWLALLILAYSFTMITRGLAIFDDYAHLPTTSILATGDIPPRFALNPNASYGYHYFLMLFVAQLMRLGDIFPWVALDLGRGLSFGLGIVLTAIWVQRLTFSRLAGFIGGTLAAFISGTRWLMLLLPSGMYNRISNSVEMIGSAAQSAPSLAEALTGKWVMEGAGPFAFPFAFANGINQPGILAHGPNGMIGAAMGTPLLLTFNRWKGWRGGVISTILMGAGSLVSETGLALSLAAWAGITLFEMIRTRKFAVPATLRNWWLVLVASLVITILQGGTWSDVVVGGLARLFSGVTPESYQTMGFGLVWPPTVVSSHLGVLSLANPTQLFTALIEIGPALILLPLAIIYGIKAFRNKRWYEAASILGGLITIPLLFVQYTGSAGVRNTSRLYGFIGLAQGWGMPLAWMWARKRSETIKAALAVLGSVVVFGGMVLLGIEMTAAQKPVRSSFITELDEPFAAAYWNKLDKNYMLFDSNPSRGVTLFGLFTNASDTWLIQKKEWEVLYEKPDPYDLRAAGYGYLYIDNVYWYDIKTLEKAHLRDACVQLVKEVKHKRLDDFRRLYDIRTCIK